MAKHTAALKFLLKSKNWQIPHLQTQLSELPEEQKNELPPPWGSSEASRDPKGARKAWLKDAQEAEKKFRYALSVALKKHDCACINHTAARERARRPGKTGRIFRELLDTRRANGKDILTTGEGADRDHPCTADTMHRDFSGHFD